MMMIDAGRFSIVWPSDGHEVEFSVRALVSSLAFKSPNSVLALVGKDVGGEEQACHRRGTLIHLQ